jgi:hypothetical protein
MTIVATTDDTVYGCSAGENFCPVSSASVSIGGLSGTFASLYVFLDYTSGCSGSPDNPGVLACAGIDDGDGSGNLVAIANNNLATYPFGTSIGPLSDPAPWGSGSFHVDESGQNLELWGWSNGTFTAAAVGSVPEPSSLLLLGAALGMGCAAGRRKLVRSR